MVENTAVYSLQNQETQGLLSILSEYTKSFILLNQYDSQCLSFYPANQSLSYEIDYQEALEAIAQLIGALVFVWFLHKNKHLLKKNGENKINDNTLVALALLVAQSNPNEKDFNDKTNL